MYFTLALNGVFCGALEMGVCSTTVREISASLPREPRYVIEYCRSVSFAYWGLYLVLVSVLYFSAPWLVRHWLALGSVDPGTGTWIVRRLGVAALLGLPRSFYLSVCRGMERMDVSNGVDAVSQGLQSIGVAAILSYGGSMTAAVNWLAATFAIGIFLYIVACSVLLSWRALVPWLSLSAVSSNFGFSMQMGGVSALSVVHSESDKAIVSRLLPVGALGYYGVVSNMMVKATLATSAVAQAAFPSLSAVIRNTSRAEALSRYRRLHDLICFGTVPIFTGVVFFAPTLMSYLFDNHVARLMMIPVAWLALGHYMNATLNIPFMFSLADGRPDIALAENVIALFASLPAAVLFVYWYGLAGAGFSWVFYHLVLYSYGVPRTCRECLGTPVWDWFAHIARIGLLTAASYGAIWWVGTATGMSATFWGLTLSYLVGSLAFLAGARMMICEELQNALAGTLARFWQIREPAA